MLHTVLDIARSLFMFYVGFYYGRSKWSNWSNPKD